VRDEDGAVGAEPPQPTSVRTIANAIAHGHRASVTRTDCPILNRYGEYRPLVLTRLHRALHPKQNSTPSPPNSTAGLDKPSAGRHHHKYSTKCCDDHLISQQLCVGR
jgi:hypothetical protein